MGLVSGARYTGYAGRPGLIGTIQAAAGEVARELVRSGLRGGFLSDLPEDVAERLLAGAIRISVPAGALSTATARARASSWS